MLHIKKPFLRCCGYKLRQCAAPVPPPGRESERVTAARVDGDLSPRQPFPWTSLGRCFAVRLPPWGATQMPERADCWSELWAGSRRRTLLVGCPPRCLRAVMWADLRAGSEPGRCPPSRQSCAPPTPFLTPHSCVCRCSGRGPTLSSSPWRACSMTLSRMAR